MLRISKAVSGLLVICAMCADPAASQSGGQRVGALDESEVASAEDRPSPSPIRFRQLDALRLPVDLAVVAIHQDELGFMWFGTEDGLFRVDGYDVRAYRPVPFDTTSMPDPWANGFARAGDGKFWVSTQSGGLARYDARRDAFDRHAAVAPRRLKAVAVGPDSLVWLATANDGLYRFDPRAGESVRVGITGGAPTDLPSKEVNALQIGLDGTLWIATQDGLCRFNRQRGTCRTYLHDPNDPGSLPGDRIQSLHEDERGDIWIGVFGGTLARYDFDADRFVRHKIPDAGRGNVLALNSLPDGRILIGLDAGMDLFDPATARFQQYRHTPGDRSTVAAGSVYSFHLDPYGTMWVGTDTGVSYFSTDPSPFAHYTHRPDDPNSLSDPEVWSVYEDESGVVWVGTSNGLNRIDRSTGTVTRYLPDANDPSRLATGLVMGINQTLDGSFWVTTRRGGLHLFDRMTGRVIRRIAGTDEEPPGMRSEIPWWILEDSRGRTWITNGGMGCLHRVLSENTFERYCHDPSDPNTPAHNFARQMIEGRDGTLWLGTWGGGLDRIDPDSLTFTHYRHDPANRNTVPSDLILAVKEDAEGLLWLGTYGGGFSRFNPRTDMFKHYTSHDSDLPSDVVYEIQIDSRGRLWLSTNAGIVRFNPTTEAFRAFGVEDGVQDLEFNSGASFQSATGELYFGGANGINVFHPGDVQLSRAAPRVVMTGLQADGQEVRPGPSSPVSIALPYARKIRLLPDERDIAITFAAVHEVDPEHHRYRFKLDGHDDTWRMAGPERTATYTNLEPGQHRFRVSASSGDGLWNDAALSVDVIVEPRFRETTLAKVLLGFLALVAVGLFLRYHRNRLVLQHQLELEHVEADKLRDLDRTRSLFFANVSHEFRTPLTLTLGPIDDVIEGRHGDVSDAAREQLGLARRSAARVLDLINQILDVARLEAGRTPMQVQRVDIGAFVREAGEVFESLAQKKAIAYSIDTTGATADTWVDPVQIEKALFNLLSNAFKFTPAGGTIRVRVFGDDSNVMVEVRDSGPGIPASELPFVFDRFHQAEQSATLTQPGTGIGLALAREIADKHGGHITVESEEGFGSTFTLVLRRGSAHFDASQIRNVPVPTHAGPRLRPDPMLGRPSAPTDAGVPSGDTPDDEDVTTVLVVEDHPDGRAYIRFHLESHYRVLEAANGAQALNRVGDVLPDVIVSDVMMPEMDGFSLCRALKSDPDTDYIPVILLTARAAHEDRMEGLRESADAYLTKPFDPEELRVQITNLIERGRRLKRHLTQSDNRVGGDGANTGDVAPQIESLPQERAGELPSADEVLVSRIASAIDAHLSDETFTVEQLAEEVGISRTQLFRSTKRILDQSPSELIRRRRLARAAEMLAQRVGNVSEVAYATGFKSLSHFSRSFTQRYGCRPSAFAAEQTGTEDA